MDIRVLGSGCANCKRLEALVKDVLTELDVQAEVTKVQDLRAMMSYGILGTPGLVIDGEVKSAGRVPAKREIVSWVMTALATEEQKAQ